MKILLIEDEQRVANLIKRGLEEQHFVADVAYEEEQAQRNLEAVNIQLSQAELQQLNEAFPEGAFEGSRYAEQQMGMVLK